MLFEYQAVEEQKKRFRKKLEAVVEAHFDHPKLKINEIAQKLFMCERQLSRKTKRYLQMTPVEYLRKYRLLQARRMLREGFSAKQVTYSVGFSSYSYFARCFKQEFGYTTKEYKSLH